MTKTKKGPLSQKEKSFIKKNYHSKTIEELSSSLKRSTYMIDKFVKTLSFEIEDSTTEEAAEAAPELTTEKPTPIKPKAKPPTSDHLFAKNKERGVTVMTEAASMAADESKATRKESSSDVVPRYRKFIHTIKE